MCENISLILFLLQFFLIFNGRTSIMKDRRRSKPKTGWIRTVRMRKKKNLDQRLAACSYLQTEEPLTLRGHWQAHFAQIRKDGKADAPCFAEIGCGKGSFAVGMAKKYPDRNFIALEKVPDVIMLAMEKAKAEQLDNLLFVLGDAAELCESFEDGELDGLYLNFSDPWPKKRHAKRRLTAPSFLASYERILKKGGAIEMKTDNDALFEYSLESFALCGYRLSEVDRDIHKNGPMADNVMTEYESNFYSQGKNIHRLVAVAGRETP